MNDSERLCAAAIAGDLETINEVLDRDGALINCHGRVRADHRAFMAREKADGGWTPLHLAAHYGQLDCVRLLIRRGAEVNAIAANPIANTPVHTSVVGRSLDCLEEILKSSPDLTLTDATGFTAFDLAQASGATRLAAVLEGRRQKTDP